MCVFGRSKSAPERHYQLQLELSKQKQSTDKQFIVKPHFARARPADFHLELHSRFVFVLLPLLKMVTDAQPPSVEQAVLWGDVRSR